MNSIIPGIIISIVSISVMAATESPYKGQQTRAIKALSQQKIDGYLMGKGMGYAKAAELNNYPGPRHVLDMANELKLSAEQIQQTQAIFDSMQTRAVELGKQLVEKEKELDHKFANRQIDANTLASLVSEIGLLEVKIRNVHLAAHLEQKALLSKDQIGQYARLRGYGTMHGHKHHHAY